MNRLLVGLVVLCMACSGTPDSSGDAGAEVAPDAAAAMVPPDAGASMDAGSTDAGGSDAGSADAATTGTCNPSTTIPIPATGKSVIAGTISNAVGFDGSAAMYQSVEAGGYAAIGGGFTTWTTNTGTGSNPFRGFQITLNTDMPMACATYTSPGALTMRYSEDTNPRIWNCPGSVTIDSVNGKSFRYHITGTNCAPFNSKAAGTFSFAGEGASTNF